MSNIILLLRRIILRATVLIMEVHMVHLGIRITPELKKKLQALAKKENRTLSGQLIELIERAVKK